MRFVSKQAVAVLLAAVGIAAILPATALGSSQVVSVPTTATSGQPFSVRIACDGEHGTAIEVVASRATGGPLITAPSAAVTDGQTYGGVPTFAATVTLPTGGDWAVFAREEGNLDSAWVPWDSLPWTVGCDPAALHVASSLSHTWVTYASPPALTATITHLNGAPVANTAVQLLNFDAGAPKVMATALTNSSGKVSAKLSHSATYEPMSSRKWAWRVKGADLTGGVLGSKVTTKIKLVMSKSVFTRKTYTGTIKLTKGTKYQFWALNGDATARTAFVLRWKSSTGHTYVSVSAKQFSKKGFTVPKTGSYYWRVQFTKGSFASWAVW